MKKILCLLGILIVIVGCSSDLANTPTRQVEAYLNKYQTLDSDVMTDLNTTINSETGFTDEQRNTYRDIVKSGYQKMSYTIKDERIDGDTATVTVEVKVMDYASILNDAEVYRNDNMTEFSNEEVYDESLYIDYRLGKMQNQNEKAIYTIDFTLTKIDGKWSLDNPTSEIRSKINGIYPR